MKRALSLILALLCALPIDAMARVAVIMPSKCVTCVIDEAEDRATSKKILYQVVTGIMDRIGKPYDIIPSGRAKTEWCRTGTFATEAGDREYAAVIHVYPREFTGLANTPFGYRPDSLNLVNNGGALLVPQLFLGINGDWGPTGARDSSGFTANQTVGNSIGFSAYVQGSDIRWRFMSDEVESVNVVKAPGPYLRTVVSVRHNAAGFHGSSEKTGTERTNCVDCDSIFSPDATGQAGVWVTRINVPDGSKGIIHTHGAHYYGVEFDMPMILASMALLDSMSGGEVFDGNKLPLKAAIQIRGGWRRSERHVAGGISPDDSATFKSSIDSIAALKAKVTVGVNVDSLADYADDKNWWARGAPYVRYAPEQWGGAVDGQPLDVDTRGTTSWQRPLDPLGNARSRVLYGPDETTSDTSVFMLVRANYFKLDSVFGRDRVDRVIMGANFRSLPIGLASKAESLVSCLADAGVRGIVTNGFWSISDPNMSYNTNPLSLSQTGGKHYIRYGRSAGGYLWNFTTPGYADSGSAFYQGNAVSANPATHMRKTNAFWQGMFTGRHQSPYISPTYQYYGKSDSTQLAVNSPYTRIFTIHAGDLGSGTRDDAAERPSRNGFWSIKSLVNAARSINNLAQRTIVEFVYPSEIDK